MKLSKLAERIAGALEGEDVEITGINTITDARHGEITFLSNPRYAKFVNDTKASAIIIDRKLPKPEIPAVRTDDPYYATLRVVKMFHPEPEPRIKGIHPTAVISESASLGHDVGIGPGVVIGEKTVIGDRVSISANSVIEADCAIGDDTFIHSKVTVRHDVKIGKRVIIHPGAVIGSEGFGFAPVEDRFEKIPQVGTVIIEDDVDIGSNTCIDRAFLGFTRICRGAKLDNLIQIGHNVEVGPHTVIAAQTGISGSTHIGQGVMMGGQVGTVGHIIIGDGARVGAQSGVSKDVPPGVTVFGYPARPIMETKRIEASLRKLPDMVKRMTQIEKALKKPDQAR